MPGRALLDRSEPLTHDPVGAKGIYADQHASEDHRCRYQFITRRAVVFFLDKSQVSTSV
jgi:hypothetical protein